MSTEEALIEVDPALLENLDDEDYASAGYETSTASLTSSVTEYIYENGRRYHAYFGADKNMMPTDETEQDRLDMHHEILLQMMQGKLHLAPLDDPQRILDVGTGTGIWAIDVADLYPSAEVIGTDLSPIQPVWVPPNCKFEVDDAEKPWTFQADSFDFVHSRNLVQSIGDWPKYMSEVFRCTKPGGYVELAELGGVPYSDDNTIHPAIELHFNLCGQALAKIGRPFVTSAELKTFLEEAGFVDVQVADSKHPFGPWPKNKRMKQIGAMAMLMCETGFEAYGMAAMTRILGMKKEDAMKVCADALKGVKNKNHHTYNLFHVAYGRKPAKEESA